MNKDVETKKALDFIRANAGAVPKTTRTSSSWVIPEDIVNEIVAKIDEFDGACSIPLPALNKLFGWKETSARSGYLRRKLTEAYTPADDKVWHVGTRNKKAVYVFSIVEELEEE